jgi:hypothetical protein
VPHSSARAARRAPRLDLPAQPRRRVPVVVVPVRDQLAARLGARQVALGPDRAAAVDPQVADPRVRGDQIAHRRLAVVDDHQLGIREVLAQEVADRLRHPRRAIAGRHDARHQRSIARGDDRLPRRQPRRRRARGRRLHGVRNWPRTRHCAGDCHRSAARLHGRRAVATRTFRCHRDLRHDGRDIPCVRRTERASLPRWPTARDRQRLADPDQRWRRELRAVVAPAVRLVAPGLAAQPARAELVLVAPFARLEPPRLVGPPPGRHRRAMHIRRAGPHSGEPRARRADAVVHLPARPPPVALVRRADQLDRRAPRRKAEVRQAVQRRQRPHRITKSRSRRARRRRDRRLALPRAAKRRLLTPRQVGRRPRQPDPRRRDRRDQELQRPRPQHRAALQQHDHVRVGPRDQPVPARRRPPRLGGPQLRQRAQPRPRQRRTGRLVRPIGQQHHRRPGRVRPQARQRRAQPLGLAVHVNADRRDQPARRGWRHVEPIAAQMPDADLMSALHQGPATCSSIDPRTKRPLQTEGFPQHCSHRL